MRLTRICIIYVVDISSFILDKLRLVLLNILLTFLTAHIDQLLFILRPDFALLVRASLHLLYEWFWQGTIRTFRRVINCDLNIKLLMHDHYR